MMVPGNFGGGRPKGWQDEAKKDMAEVGIRIRQGQVVVGLHGLAS